MNKPSIVVETQNGCITGVYSDSDVNIVLVDYDLHDDVSPASTQAIPEPFDEMSAQTRSLANDAMERPR